MMQNADKIKNTCKLRIVKFTGPELKIQLYLY